jgi:hypothetical protein
LALTLAPPAISARTASTLPVLAHVMMGVSPVAMPAFGFAPALSRSSTSAALPFVHARESGVMPKSFARLGFACARINNSAVARSFQ